MIIIIIMIIIILIIIIIIIIIIIPRRITSHQTSLRHISLSFWSTMLINSNACNTEQTLCVRNSHFMQISNLEMTLIISILRLAISAELHLNTYIQNTELNVIVYFNT